MNVEQLNVDLADALGKLKEALQCSSCYKHMETPVTLWSCDHVFCKRCIEHRTRCPICELPAWAEDQSTNRRLQNVSTLCFKLDCYLNNDNTLSGFIQPREHCITNCTTKCERESSVNTNQLRGVKETTHKRKTANSSTTNSSIKAKPKKISKQELGALTKSDPTNKENKPDSKLFTTPKLSIKRCMPKNSRGETPLHLAAMQGKIDLVISLLAKKADVNAKDNAGWTPLHEACNQGSTEIAEKLLDAGALIDVPGYENDTPLIDAVNNHKVGIVELLLRRGANVNLRNAGGKTALDLAQTVEMKNLLSAHIAQQSSKTAEAQLTVSRPNSINIFSNIDYTSNHLKRVKKFLDANILSNAIKCTHFIVSHSSELLSKRNLKYLQAMASGAWMLNEKWVDKCLELKKWTCEQSFLIKGAYEDIVSDGPLRSVTAKLKHLPRIFDGCHFFMYGSFSPPLPTKVQLIELIKVSGGQILSREPKHDSDLVQSCRKVPYHAVPDTPQYYFTYYIVYDPSQRYLPRSVHLGKVSTVSASWVLDCISQFVICNVT